MLLRLVGAACKAAATTVTTRAATATRNVLPQGILGSSLVLQRNKVTYSTDVVGTEGNADFRVYFKNREGKRISPWHDIPLYADGECKTVNFICEMPKGTDAKMEIATKEVDNPIKQDVKKGQLRYIKYGKTIINYGTTPQTWENPDTRHKDLPDCGGDNDPVDMIEIGGKIIPRGYVVPVKPIGVLALIDEGECDWKVLCIATDDPHAENIKKLADVERVFPNLIDQIRTWYRDYKIPDGKPQNKYAFNGEAKDVEYTKAVIADCHKDWVKLVNNPELGKKHGVVVTPK